MIKIFVPLLLVTSMAVPTTCNNKTAGEKTFRSKTEMLAEHTWQPAEIARNIDGENSHYIRNGRNTTGTNYDIMRLRFMEDGSGTYTDEHGILHTTNWQFNSRDSTKITLKTGPPFANTFEWVMVGITDNTLHNTTFVGSSILVAARFVPTAE